MRALAVANGAGVETGWFTAAGTAIGAIIGAFGLWVANRVLGKATFQAAINTGFNSLLDQLQEERAASQQAVQDLRVELRTERGLRYEEQARSTAERTLLRGEIANLTQRISSLTAQLRRGGFDVEQEMVLPPGLIIIEDQSES